MNWKMTGDNTKNLLNNKCFRYLWIMKNNKTYLSDDIFLCNHHKEQKYWNIANHYFKVMRHLGTCDNLTRITHLESQTDYTIEMAFIIIVSLTSDCCQSCPVNPTTCSFQSWSKAEKREILAQTKVSSEIDSAFKGWIQHIKLCTWPHKGSVMFIAFAD